MKKIVLLQIVATIGVAVVSALLGGEGAALSAFLAGLACLVPNALFALNLSVFVKLSPSYSPLFFFIGEFVKIIAIVLLLCLIVMLYEDLVWPAMIAVLNCSFLGLLTRE